jgi:hypothetical protein
LEISGFLHEGPWSLAALASIAWTRLWRSGRYCRTSKPKMPAGPARASGRDRGLPQSSGNSSKRGQSPRTARRLIWQSNVNPRGWTSRRIGFPWHTSCCCFSRCSCPSSSLRQGAGPMFWSEASLRLEPALSHRSVLRGGAVTPVLNARRRPTSKCEPPIMQSIEPRAFRVRQSPPPTRTAGSAPAVLRRRNSFPGSGRDW